MPKTSKFVVLALLAAFATQPVYAEDAAAADKSAVLVNSVSIPQSRVDLRVKAAVSQGQTDTPELRKAIKDDLINLEIITQQASKIGLDKLPETLQQMELAKQAVLVGVFVQDYAKTNPISDADTKQEYDNLKGRLGKNEYKVSHILVDDESEAKAISAQLKKGAKFDKLAKEKTKDAGSRERGGDLGWSVPANFVKAFADTMLNMSKGQTSEPVESEFGWHIIHLDDTRDLKLPPYDEIKPNLTQRLQQQAVQKLILELRTSAKIE
jgi:peptidyl-prolyl cis-trans isomerase C